MRLPFLFLFMIVITLATQGQYIPLSAKIHEQTDRMVDSKIVATITSDTIFYRTADGSTLRVPDKGNAENMLSLWDNKTGTAYRIDPKGNVAFKNPNSPHKPNSPGGPHYEGRFPEDNVEGLKCYVVPAHVMQTAYYSGFSPRPGQSCFSTDLGLELRLDVTIQTASGKTERHQKILHDIHPNVDPDPGLFELSKYTIR